MESKGSRITQNKTLKTIYNQRYLFLLAIPALLIILIFNYFPMYGILISFKKYSVSKGIMGSPWIGFDHFISFFRNPYSRRIIKNTLLIGSYSVLWGFPAPIILALLLNEIKNEKFKKITQTVSYFPHFLSSIIVVGMMADFAVSSGLFNQIRGVFGLDPITFMAEKSWFRTLYIGSGIWQGVGWGTIIYLAALSGIDPFLYEASEVDGANRWHQAIHITIPSIMPTVIILFILQVGKVVNVGFEKIMLMYNPATYEVADVISTYVFRQGIEGALFSYSSAVGLMNSVVSFILVLATNMLSRKYSETSLW